MEFNWKGIKKLVHCAGIHTALVTQEAGRGGWKALSNLEFRVLSTE